jgi:hypothetical protein
MAWGRLTLMFALVNAASSKLSSLHQRESVKRRIASPKSCVLGQRPTKPKEAKFPIGIIESPEFQKKLHSEQDINYCK